MAARPVPSGGSEEAEARSLLAAVRELDIDRYAVVGSCLRYDERSRNHLKVFRQRLAETYFGRTTLPRNFLLWGSPGSGKSYLVQQVAQSLPAGVTYLELNLAQLDQEGLRKGLDRFASTPGPGLCFVDEIDAQPDQAWPYEVLLPYLEPVVPRNAPTVYCLAGSGGASVEELAGRLRDRPKGVDLMSRIPRGNEFVVGPLGVGDKVLVAAVQVLLAARAEGHEIREIEKFALYYLAVQPAFASARQLRSRATQCAQRVPPAEDRIRYDYLFHAGDPENKRFWSEAASVRSELEDSFVRILPGTGVGPARSGPMATASTGRAVAPPGPPSPPRIAVLPLSNISPDPADDYFADGLTDELITQVSRISSLRVIARTSILQFKGSTRTIKEIGEALGVRLALEGSVRKSGQQLRVTVKLVDTSTEEQVWTSRYDRPLSDVFTIQDEIATHIATSISSHLSAVGAVAVVPVVRANVPTRDFEAYSMFLRARKLFAEKGNESTMREALSLFEAAVARDPHFARARLGIAECVDWLVTEGATSFHDGEARAFREVQQAIADDPDLAEAHSVLAGQLLARDEVAASEREARRALELNPSLADPYRWLAQIAAGKSRIDQSVELLRSALQIDPLDANVAAFLARSYLYAGRLPEAEAQWAQNRSRIPFRTYAQCAERDYATGDLVHLEHDLHEMERLRSPENGWTEMFRGLLAAKRGDADGARAVLDRLERRALADHATQIHIAPVRWAIGDSDGGVAALEAAFAIHQLPFLELLYSPLYDRARADPRIQDLVQRQRALSGSAPTDAAGPEARPL